MDHADHPILRRRSLALARPPQQDEVERAAALDGVIEARADGPRLRLGYDLRRVTLGELTPRLRAQGLEPSDSLLARLCRAWGAFQDDNRRDQSKIVHQCCNVPPAKK
ncbi:hypothetical protein CU669_05385 [Paramagnetospirillum kuznetsovii]|uniref:Uncharacterized protein n=1 Tax=Paramagnetospirillum kuznetsovii TaxID=2053833 RepID=A0A364P0F6_9PROT|nr:hypothetical protein [Paramagnetospirillum kuznetsovii]RAU22822.1 hypothetical protein CU669_05385 [Paramagnetospirillum kuznetsovii]